MTSEPENQITLVWSAEDIQELCPNMSDEEAIEALHVIRDVFKERSTEEGWNILEGALEFYGFIPEQED